ncbi:MAG TPA: right-handed parallel beta-helix repeat-containing protein, partial [Thermoanaerobaculia bacterium]|nr:right-handed parallel beta-helix repeat-containing protein [Thermoanaerobaculia bacterium]
MRRTRARAALAAGIAAAVASAAAAQQPALTLVPTPPHSLPIEQAVLLAGRPFPTVHTTALRLPEPRRTFFVAARGEAGDGTEARPWNDLQAALARLTPGDRLRVRAGSYPRTASIVEGCADGSERQPIQVVFDGKAELEPAEGSPALVLARAHWIIVGPYAKLGGSGAPGILLRGHGAHDVRLLGARVSDGMAPGIRVEPEAARVTIRGAYISKTKLEKMGPSSYGIEIAAGTREVDVTDSHLSNNPSGSIRVRAPEGSQRPARDVQIRGNTIRDDGATAIAVDAADGLTIADNTLSDRTGVDGTRGVALERVERAFVRTNQITGFGAGVAVGHADPDGGRVLAARDVWLERNHLEGSAGGAAF